MSDPTHEQLSAFMDGELDAEPARFLLHRFLQDTEMRGRWYRYHLVRETLRRGLPAAVDCGFAARVFGRLDSRTGRTPPRLRSLPPLIARPLAGLAVAAAVATVAVLGFQYVGPTIQPAAPLAARVSAGAAAPGFEPTAVTETGATAAVPAAVADAEAARLNAYLVNHSEYAGGPGMGGMLSYVRIVGYDPGGGADRR